MLSTHAFSVLISDVYKCALDEDHWPATVAHLCDVFRGIRADMVVIDGSTGAAVMKCYHNYAPDLVEALEANGHLNPLTPLVLVHPLDEPLIGERVYGLEAFRKSLYFQRALSAVDVVDIMVLPLARNVSVGAGIGISRGHAVGPFDDDDAALARLLIPHLRRAADISRLLKRSAANEATIAALIGAMAAPAFLLARGGTILQMNASAAEETTKAALLRVAGDKLVGTVPAVSRFLLSLEAPKADGRSCSDVLVRVDARGDVLLTAIGLAEPMVADGATTLLVLRVPEPDLVTPLTVARDVFGLTSAEVLTLAQIVGGRSLQEAGEVLGIARSTVKSHLDSIYAKAGVGKQTELVAKVMAMMRPLP